MVDLVAAPMPGCMLCGKPSPRLRFVESVCGAHPTPRRSRPTSAGKSVRLGVRLSRKALLIRGLWWIGGVGVAIWGGAVGCSRLAAPREENV